MNTIPTQQSGCDCLPCEDTGSGGTGPQGTPGTNGTNGSDGDDGINSYTTTSAAFTMPAISGSVSIAVLVSAWATIGQVIYVQGVGYFTVASKPDSTHISITNLGYTGNAAPGTVTASGLQVGPGGIKGTDGAAGSTTLNTLSPTTTKGDIIVDNGANNPAANDVRLAVGSNGKALVADSSQATGLKYATITPNTVTNDNNIPRFDGTAVTPMPLQDSKLLITDDGAIQSTPSGGNARGSKAVDLQVDRAAATQVASAANSVIVGGKNNTASGLESVVSGGLSNVASGQESNVGGGALNTASGATSNVGGGSNNVSSGDYSTVGGGVDHDASGLNSTIGGGEDNTASNDASTVSGGTTNIASGVSSTVSGGNSNVASGDNSTVIGGNTNTASADGSAVIGGRQALADKYGQVSQSAGIFSAQGDSQTSVLVMRKSTTDATPTALALDGASAKLTISPNTTWAFRILIVARRTDVDDEGAAYQLLGAIDRNSAAGTTALIGSVTKTVIAEDTAAWDVNCTADSVSGALSITVTGEAAKTINWVARIELCECSG